MIGTLYTIIAFIVALAILIIVHEFGHYWVAKRMGVKVLRFSVGFGKVLWSKKVGQDQTELVLSAIPLGGYVKMLGEDDDDVPEEEMNRAFNRQHVLKRSAIVLAGPMFNFLFAIIAYWVLFMAGVDDLKAIVGDVRSDSIAAQSGFVRGEEIIAIDGMENRGWGEHRLYLFNRAIDQSAAVFTTRDTNGQVHERVVDFSTIAVSEIKAGFMVSEVGLSGYLPEIEAIAGRVEEGPAKTAGMQDGDRIAQINDKAIGSWSELVSVISGNAGVPLRITVERQGLLVPLEVTPSSVEHDGQRIGRINIRPQIPEIPADLLVKLRYGPLDSMWYGARQTWIMSVLTLKMFYKMLKLEVSTKNISGPITIAQYAGHSAQIGLDRFLMFLAIVSISLGVLNLLPIPILDGGHLLYYLVEAVKGGPLSERTMQWGQQIGMVILAGLMVLAFYNDITRLFQ